MHAVFTRVKTRVRTNKQPSLAVGVLHKAKQADWRYFLSLLRNAVTVEGGTTRIPISPRPKFFQLVGIAHGLLAIAFTLFKRSFDRRPQARVIIVGQGQKFERLEFPRNRR